MSEVAALATTIPMRITNKHLVKNNAFGVHNGFGGGPFNADVINNMSSLVGMMQQFGLRPQGGLTNLQIMGPANPPRAASMPAPLALLPPPGAPVQPPFQPPAMAPAPVHTPPGPVDEKMVELPDVSQQPSLVSAAASLQAAFNEAKANAAAEPKEDDAEEPEGQDIKGVEPTAQLPDKSNGKGKPAAKAKSQSKTAKKVVPQAKPQAVKKTSKVEKKKNDLALRREAGIPTALLRKYSDGCARCRWRPLCTKSCWASRDYYI